MSATQGRHGHGAAGAEDMLNDFWATRPRRPRRGRKIAGVAAGIANRYRIDPTLVRVGFVVAAFYGGAGIVLYLLGWVLLPEQDDEVSPLEAVIGKGRSSTSTGFTVLLCLGMIPLFSWFGGSFPSWLGLLVAVGLLVLLHRSRGHLAAPTPPTPPVPDVPDVPMPGMPGFAAETHTTPRAETAPVAESTPEPEPRREQPAARAEDVAPEPESRTGPPAWDPLGAAPFAWDLPEPAPAREESEPPPPQRRRKSRVGLVTVGAALVVGGALAMVQNGWINEQHIVGILLAVVGIGMVIGAFLRGGKGLIGLAVPLAVVGIGLTTVSPEGWSGVGDIRDRPTTTDAVRSVYERSVGDIVLDLTALPNDGEVHTQVRSGVGDVTVIVPAYAAVEVECDGAAGNIDCLGEKRTEFDSDVPTIVSEGSGGPDGLMIDLDVEVETAGNVEVRRG